MTCPDCERNKYRAALWRAEAYKQAGHDVIERKWVGLTTDEINKAVVETSTDVFEGDIYKFATMLETILKEKNSG